ncbi:DUF5703 domain-containing protein [Chitinophaga sp. 22321]|uniref:DUF5703 domain-containing protein n=1 Tax=Chitinophaga hostae TaxID=2831022 RepID=A0ABS5IXW9_9BACT|nr:DUF5703 domain-containing protein [Chitinophaga hostae]MBS0027688.1 hypothetical protein [Chitinophaga hostae]
MIKRKWFLLFIFLFGFAASFAQQVDDYNIKWTTPGENSNGSMPIGNGDIGANVWIAANGDLVFYVSKTDAWSEIGRLLKLGRVRVSISPNPFNEKAFIQELRLQNGEIQISYGDTKIKFWIDAHHPVIQTDIRSKKPIRVKVVYENWRKTKRPIVGQEDGSVWGIGARQVTKDCPTEIFSEPDTVFSGNKDNITACHHNDYSIWKHNLEIQSLTDISTYQPDPLMHRNFGLMIKGSGLINQSDTILISSKASTSIQINSYPLTTQGSIKEWQQKLGEQVFAIAATPSKKRVAMHERWWKSFWNRSYIYVSADNPEQQQWANIVTQGYILQRFINACGGRGNSPVKFNGSIFTVDTYEIDGPYKGFDADFRLWGGCYWWQNTRLPYWSMLLSGDFDLMRPLFRMYMAALPLRKDATRKYYGHEGAYYPETMNFWGTYADGDYGCDRTNVPLGFARNPYITYYWQGALELSLMMNDYYNFTKNTGFARDTLVPFVTEILTFFDQHWKRGNDGKILFNPSASLETFHKAVDPLPEIVGIRAVAEKMLSLPKAFTTDKLRSQWLKLIEDLPAVPLRTVGKDTLLSPAHEYSNKANSENPEMYGVFPYRAFVLGKPGLQIGVNTFLSRTHKENGGWQQSSIQAAYLGLSDEAKRMIIENFSTRDKNMRFPAFWGPNYDWTPDQDHGNVAMIALQRMLIQYDTDRVKLLPAWPREWNVAFKLTGPYGKVYEGRYKNGNLKYISR